jgi:hypothetical protein
MDSLRHTVVVQLPEDCRANPLRIYSTPAKKVAKCKLNCVKAVRRKALKTDTLE